MLNHREERTNQHSERSEEQRSEEQVTSLESWNGTYRNWPSYNFWRPPSDWARWLIIMKRVVRLVMVGWNSTLYLYQGVTAQRMNNWFSGLTLKRHGRVFSLRSARQIELTDPCTPWVWTIVWNRMNGQRSKLQWLSRQTWFDVTLVQHVHWLH